MSWIPCKKGKYSWQTDTSDLPIGKYVCLYSEGRVYAGELVRKPKLFPFLKRVCLKMHIGTGYVYDDLIVDFATHYKIVDTPYS